MHFNCTIWPILIWNCAKSKNCSFLLIFTVTLKHILKISLYFHKNYFWKILCKLLKSESWRFPQSCIIVLLIFILFILKIFLIFYNLLLNRSYVFLFSRHLIHLINLRHNTALQQSRKYKFHIILDLLNSQFIFLLISDFVLNNPPPELTRSQSNLLIFVH